MIAKLQRTLAEGIAAVEAVGGKYAIVGGLAVGARATPPRDARRGPLLSNSRC